MSSGLRGVRKRKGTSVTKCSILTRNRSKVDRLRESLNELNLEERKSKVTRNKPCKNALRMEVQLYDFKFDNGISDQGTGISALTSTEIPLGRSTLERRHTAVRPDVKKVNFGSSQQYGVEKSKFDMFSSGELFESDNIKTVNAGSKHDKEVLDAFGPLTNQCPFSTSLCVIESGVKSLEGDDDDDDNDGDDDNDDINKDQYFSSPPNSPLYDMPPPSTPAQKRARRAKRQLQLERWRTYEASKSRQERYQRRAQVAAETADRPVLDLRRVQWSNNLVQTVYIDDIIE